MIRTDALTKRFGELVAVDAVSLDVREGEVFGLLGPNGAGKTTIVRMLSSLISPTGGSAEVAGCTLGSEREELRLRSRIGVLPENVGLYEGLSAYENLWYFGRLHRVETTALRKSIERLLRMLDLWDRRDRTVGGFSKGMKQKVALARALVHDPVLLFLDEPTANLDPEAAKTVRELILDLKKERRTIFLNTHNLDEAQRICDRVAVLRTRLLAVGAPNELESKLRAGRTRLRLEHASETIAAAIRERTGLGKVEVVGDMLIVDVNDPDRDNPAIAEAVIAAGGRLREMSPLSPSLEDVYLRLVRQEEGAS